MKPDCYNLLPNSFQSTRPARGATARRDRQSRSRAVSIHAPRTGRDVSRTVGCSPGGGFNPRAPHGARRSLVALGGQPGTFQSTRPARGATFACSTRRTTGYVSIHAPRTGRDYGSVVDSSPIAWFQSTRPARGATSQTCVSSTGQTVSIHAPRTGRDRNHYKLTNRNHLPSPQRGPSSQRPFHDAAPPTLPPHLL